VTDLGPTAFGPVSEFDPAAFTPMIDVPVNPNDELLVHIWARNNTASDILLRYLRFDPRASSFPYSLFGIDIDTGSQPLDGVPNLWFDYSELDPIGDGLGLFPAAGPLSTGPYNDYSNTLQGIPPVPVVQGTDFSAGSGDPFLRPQIPMPPSRWVHLGAMPITVPTGTTSYTIDLLNVANTDLNFGAVISFGFGIEPGDPITQFASAPGADGTIAYAGSAECGGMILYDGVLQRFQRPVFECCGNGVVESGETCDDGMSNSDTAPDACRTACVPPSCGDGVVDTGEACDDGLNNSDTEPGACHTDCSRQAELIIHVKADASGANDGSSWDDAFVTVQDAIALATSGDQIWVAAGVYRPDDVGTSLDREASIVLKSGVQLYGGFAGNESALADRDFQTYQSILSGDLLGNDAVVVCSTDNECSNHGRRCVNGACDLRAMIDDNSYTVVLALGVSADTVLDGFVITGGHANGPATANVTPEEYGAGMFVRYVDADIPIPSEPVIRNCRFEWNTAFTWGGAVFAQAHPTAPDGPSFESCVFSRNSSFDPSSLAVPLGGALCSFDTDIRLEQCTFEYNVAAGGIGGAGGAIGTQNSVFNLWLARFPSMKINRCTFSENLTDGFGGAMYDSHNDTVFTNCTFVGNRAGSGGAYANVGGQPTVVNSVFVGNAATELSSIVASQSGGGLAMPGSDTEQEATIVNSLFVGNTATDSGGGIFWRPMDNPAGIRRIANSIVRGNMAGGSPDQIFVDGTPELAPEITFCNVEDGWTNAYCPAGFPACNIDADPLFASPGTGDFRVELGSPCIDAGDNGIVLALGIDTDAGGLPRRFDDCHTVDTGWGQPPLVDMGPHEFAYDGVPDDCDPCAADDPVDSDGDGVSDCADQCPGVDDADFAPECGGAIPTVSAWGLVAMALLLLTGIKINFGRRQSKPT